MKRLFATLLVLTSLASSLRASPPFRYDSAVRWAEEVVISDIPKTTRLYVVGPTKFTKPPGQAMHYDIRIPRIVTWRNGLTLGQLLKELNDEPPPKFEVLVYREANQIFPVTNLLEEEAIESNFVLQARDVVFIREPLPVAPPGHFPTVP